MNPTPTVTAGDSLTSNPNMIMLHPMAQITWKIHTWYKGSKVQPRVMTVTSRKISHAPRLSKKTLSSALVLRCPDKYAEIPERNKTVGAQKWVIHLVKNVVQGHDNHDAAAEDINGGNARFDGGGNIGETRFSGSSSERGIHTGNIGINPDSILRRSTTL